MTYFGNKNALGHTCSQEVRELLRQQKLGKKYALGHIVTEEASKLISIRVRESMANDEVREKCRWRTGLTKETDSRVAKQSLSLKKYLEDPEIRSEQVRKLWIALGKKPNKIETFLNNLLQENFPNEWEYVGNGKLIINGLIPDFANINGKKQLIELYGDYWHRGQDPQDRIGKLAKLGYGCLVIWESELGNKEQVINRIANFK